jgi:DNA replication protein DnaC
MSVTQSKYNEIIREYDKKKLNIHYEKSRRLKEVYDKVPRIKEIDDEISSLSVATAKSMLLANDNQLALASYKSKMEDLKREKERLYIAHFPANYLEPDYECKDCKDTGYIGSDRCHCFKNKIIEVLYEQSNLKDILSKENFDTFNLRLYKPDVIDHATGTNSLENISRAITVAKEFINNFGTVSDNLFIYGATGVGKTFLTNCIAKEIMDASHSVVYVSAIKLFDILANNAFNRDSSDDREIYANIFQCDLLIIDDLGTELINSFTSSQLFNCINERYLNKKSVIISTNLSLSEIREHYSERVFSRITSNYTLLKIFGNDLRIQKVLE